MFSLLSRPAAQQGTASRDPFSLIDAMFNDWVGQRTGSSLISRARLDVAERDDAYEVRVELPGARKDDISVDVEGSWVAISAKANTQTEKKEGERLLYCERSHESYARSFELPQAVDSAKANACTSDHSSWR